jgi:hypothetical protein
MRYQFRTYGGAIIGQSPGSCWYLFVLAIADDGTLRLEERAAYLSPGMRFGGGMDISE